MFVPKVFAADAERRFFKMRGGKKLVAHEGTRGLREERERTGGEGRDGTLCQSDQQRSSYTTAYEADLMKGQALGRDWTNLLSMTVNQSAFLFSVKPAGGFQLV